MRRRRLKDRITSRLAKNFSLPWMLEWPQRFHIVPTNACNLRCRACSKTLHDTDNSHMSREVYDRVRTDILPHAREVHLQGLGEPTLAPLFDEMLEDAVRHGLFISFVTNASHLSPEHIKLLVKTYAAVTVSVDGARAESHEFSRPGSNFEQVMGVVEKLSAARRNSSSCNLQINFSTVLTNHNIGEVPDILRLAQRYGVDTIRLITPSMEGREDDFALSGIGRHENLYLHHLPQILEARRLTGVTLVLPDNIEQQADSPTDGEKTSRSVRPARRIFPRKCLVPWQEAFIGTGGWVHACCVACCAAMGNLLVDDFRTIWNNRHYRRLRRTVNTNNPPGFCRGCSLSEGITGGDPMHLDRLYEQGLPRLAQPPSVGERWSEEEGRVVDA